MIGETGERKSAVATPDGKSRKKKKKKIKFALKYTNIINVTHFQAISPPSVRNSDVTTLTLKADVSGAVC